MLTMMKLFMALKRDERGISALEYAVLAALILVAVVVGVQLIDPAGLFKAAGDAVDQATAAAG